MKILIIVCAISLMIATGCQLRPRLARGGGASAQLPGGLSAGTAAPDSPATPTSQNITRNIVREYAPPAAAAAPTLAPAAPNAVQPGHVQDKATVPPPPAPPALVREHIVETAAANVGVAQVDRSGEIFASISAMRPVQILGAVLVVGALAMFHPVVRLTIGAGKQMQAIAGGAGVLCLFGPQVLAGNETLVIIVAGVGVLGAYLLSRLSYKEAIADTIKTTPPPSPEKSGA